MKPEPVIPGENPTVAGSLARIVGVLVLVIGVFLLMPKAAQERILELASGDVAPKPALGGPLFFIPASETVEIPINPLVELDFRTRKDILAERVRLLAPFSRLVSASYEPSAAVFGQIIDGKPWWGIEGTFWYGNGSQSIAGPAEESRFVDNPLLLVGVIEPNAYAARREVSPLGPPYPRPRKVTWDGSRRTLSVRYDVGRYFAFERAIHPRSPGKELYLVAYNARDLGFGFMQIRSAECRNLALDDGQTGIHPLIQYIHLGQSCGYPGGGNNMSPNQRVMQFAVTTLPAQMTVGLWHENPTPGLPEPEVRVCLQLE